MTKGAYDVNDTYVGPTKDGSFRSCLCTMLIFVSICGILLIVALTWGNSSRYGKPSPGNNLGSADQQTGYQNTNQENESVKSKEQSNSKPTKRPVITTTARYTDINEYTTSKEDNQIVPKDEDNDNSKETVTDRPLGEKPAKSGKLITPLTDNTTTTEPVPTKPAKVDNPEEKTNKSPESVTRAETPETTTISETAVLSNGLKPNYKSDSESEQKIITNDENTTSTSSTTTTESKFYENKDYTKSKDEDRETTKSYNTNYKEGTTPPVITKQPENDITTEIPLVNEDKLKNLTAKVEDKPIITPLPITTEEPGNDYTTVIFTVNEDNLKTLPKKKPEDKAKDEDKTIITPLPITTEEPGDDYTTVIITVNEDNMKTLPKKKPEDKAKDEDKTIITPLPTTTEEPEDDYTTVIITANEDNLKTLPKKKPEDKAKDEDKTIITPLPTTTEEPEDDYTTVIITANEDNLKTLPKKKPEDKAKDEDKTIITPLPTTTEEPGDDYTTVIITENEDNLKTLPKKKPEDKAKDEDKTIITPLPTTTEEPEDDYTTVIITVNEDNLKTLPKKKPEDKAKDEDKTIITPLATTTEEPEDDYTTVIITENEDNLKTLPKKKPEDRAKDEDKTIITPLPTTTEEPGDDYTTVIITVNEDNLKTLPKKKPEDKAKDEDKTIITPLPTTTEEPGDDYTTVIITVNEDNLKTLPKKKPEDKAEDEDKTIITPLPTTTEEPEDDYTTVIITVNEDNLKTLPKKKPEDKAKDEDKTIITPLPTTTEEPEDDYTSVNPSVNEDNLINLSNEKSEDEDRTTTTVEPEDDNTTVSVKEDKFKNLPNEKSEDKAEDENNTTTTLEPEDNTTVIPPVNENNSEDTLTNLTKNPKVYENEKTTMSPRSKKDNSKEKEDKMTTVLPEITTIINESKLTKLSDITTQKPITEITPRPIIMETEDVEQITRNTAAPNNHFNQNQNNLEDECNAECRKVGARILGRMNYSAGADPCEQFYDYACGGDNSDNVPKDNWKQIAGRLDRINAESPTSYQTFRRFYDSCVDFHSNYDYEKRIEAAKQILSSVGQPQQTKADDEGKLALTNLLTQLLQLDSSPLFDISVDVDKESKHFIFQLNIGKKFSTLQNEASALPSKRKCIAKSKKHFGFSLSHFDYIDLNDMYKIYLNCQQNETYDQETSNRALEAFDLHEDLETSLQDVENILEDIRKLPPPASIRKDIITKNFVVRKVSELAFHYPLIEWKQILSSLTGKEVHEEDLVQVYLKDYFFTLFSGKQKLSRLELHNALLTMFIHDLYTNFVLPTSMANPEEFCLQQSTDTMKEVASSLYLKSINQNDIKGDQKRIEDLFAKMKQKLKEILQSAEWAEGARFSLIKKLNNIDLDSWDRSLIWENITLLQERMMSVNNVFGDYSDFLPALIRRNRQMLYNMWDTMGYVEQNVWWHFLTPYSTRPVSIYALNKIVIPPAMLFTMSKDIPRYLSLAKLGYSLAKAIGYHFDYIGSKYDVYLDQKSKLAYDETKSCSLTRFKHPFQMEHDGKNVLFKVNNDSLTLSFNERFVEDMAINLVSAMSNEDVTDYQISWISSNFDLDEHFTREKIFFIALAQEHCRKPQLGDFLLHLFESEHLPPSLLLDTAVSHSELFNDVFNCKQGARLNAVYKCQAFPELPEVEDYYNDNNN